MLPIQAVLLGALQGLTELFPVSSLGHSVLLPHLLNWNINEQANSFLIFLVATHLATSLVLFWYYRTEWVRIVKGMLSSLKDREIAASNPYGKIGWLLVAGTVPAGILGLLFEDKLKQLFASPIPVSVFLILNGLMLIGIERTITSRTTSRNASVSAHAIANLTWWQSIKIGLFQCLALLPGFSRTGTTVAGGLVEQLDHPNAAHFSFMLATPIIFAAAALKLPELIGSDMRGELGTILIGAASSAVFAYIAVTFLSNYFKTKTLTPFGAYCIIAGTFCLVYFLV